MLTNQLLSVIKYPEAAKMNSPTRGWLEQILCSKRIPSKSKSILSTSLTTAAKLALLFYSVNYTQPTSHLGPLFFRDNFMDRCVFLACWCAALCWWSKKKKNTMKNQTAPLPEQRTDTFDSVDFIFILFHKVGSIMRGKKTTVLRTEKNRRKRHGVFF